MCSYEPAASQLLDDAEMPKWPILAVVIVLGAPTAGADKQHRDVMAMELIPAARAAEANFKASCECALAVVIDDSIKTIDEMVSARYIADEVSTGAAKYCTDAGSRKAMCQMKTLRLASASHPTFTFDAGVGIATTNGEHHATWDMITRVLDK